MITVVLAQGQLEHSVGPTQEMSRGGCSELGFGCSASFGTNQPINWTDSYAFFSVGGGGGAGGGGFNVLGLWTTEHYQWPSTYGKNNWICEN